MQYEELKHGHRIGSRAYGHSVMVRVKGEVEELEKKLNAALKEIVIVREALAKSIEQSESWEEVVAMIREFLIDQGIDMLDTPPMMYPEAICNLISMKIREDRMERKV